VSRSTAYMLLLKHLALIPFFASLIAARTMSQNFIVVFKEHATPDQINAYADEVSQGGGEVGHRYDSPVMKGFSATLTETQVQSFQSNDIIDYIEPDQKVSIQ